MKNQAIILFCLVFFSLKAQNQLGLRTSNYTGVNGILLNPSSFQSSTYTWDVNIIGAGIFMYNEFAYMENTSLMGLLTHNGPINYRSMSPEAPPNDPNALYFNFFDQTDRFSNSGNLFIHGPSGMVRFGKYSVGLFTNFRAAGAGNRLDRDLDHLSLDGWVAGDTKIFSPFNMSIMAWSEIGLNLSTTVKKKLSHKIDIGINLKYIIGHEAFYFRNRNSTTVTSLNDTTVIDGGPLEYGIASSLANGGFGINGSGFSTDIGFTYIKIKDRSKRYDWKLGVSIVDLGFIHFDQNAQKHILNEGTVYELDQNNIANADGIDGTLESISQEAFGNASQSRTANDFTILTPSAVSVQFDYPINKRWYLNATANRRFNLHPVTIDRENFFSVSGRYETPLFEVGVPVVLYNDQHLRVGTWVRFGWLTVGSDHINSVVLNQSQFAGSDVYFSIRINGQNNPFSKKKRGRNGKKRDLENCYF